MVPSSIIIVTVDGEHLTCGGFCLSETVCHGKFEFIADYFGGLSLSSKRCNAGAALTGPTHSGASTPWWAMIEDSTDEFLMTSRGERSFGLPSPRSVARDLWSLPSQQHYG
jgi:hypothetical protein